MSSEELRHFAVVGQTQQLQNLLSGGANPCSTDSIGLTALHYAVWNKHEECVQALIANDRGTFEDGTHGSCVNIQSKTGFTALHIALIEYIRSSPEEVNSEDCTIERKKIERCIHYLVMSGKLDVNLKDLQGKSAYDMAREQDNQIPQAILDMLNMKTKPSQAQTDEFLKEFIVPYQVQKRNMFSESRSVLTAETHGKITLNKNQRILIPKELNMHEHEIYEFAKLNFLANRQHGAKNIKNLVYALNQAKENVKRRKKLVH